MRAHRDGTTGQKKNCDVVIYHSRPVASGSEASNPFLNTFPIVARRRLCGRAGFALELGRVSHISGFRSLPRTRVGRRGSTPAPPLPWPCRAAASLSSRPTALSPRRSGRRHSPQTGRAFTGRACAARSPQAASPRRSGQRRVRRISAPAQPASRGAPLATQWPQLPPKHRRAFFGRESTAFDRPPSRRAQVWPLLLGVLDPGADSATRARLRCGPGRGRLALRFPPPPTDRTLPPSHPLHPRGSLAETRTRARPPRPGRSSAPSTHSSLPAPPTPRRPPPPSPPAAGRGSGQRSSRASTWTSPGLTRRRGSESLPSAPRAPLASRASGNNADQFASENGPPSSLLPPPRRAAQYFAAPGSAGASDELRRILRAYALADPRTGYCQGMADLASAMLQAAARDEAGAFALFRALLQRRLRPLFADSCAGLRPHFRRVAQIVRARGSRQAPHPPSQTQLQ